MAVTLEQAKAHLRVVHSADDTLITGLIAVSTDYVESVGAAIADPMPTPVAHAILLLISHFYEHRDAATEQPPKAIAFGVAALCAPFTEYNL